MSDKYVLPVEIVLTAPEVCWKINCGTGYVYVKHSQKPSSLQQNRSCQGAGYAGGAGAEKAKDQSKCN